MLSKYTAGESLEEDGDWSKESWSVLKLHSIRTYGWLPNASSSHVEAGGD